MYPKHLALPTLLLAALLAVALGRPVGSAVAGPTPQWFARYHGSVASSASDTGVSVAADGSGNVFVLGQVDNGAGHGLDLALVKYNGSGAQQWVATYDGTGHADDTAVALALDGSGNVLVLGTADNGTDTDLVVLKYRGTTGAAMWTAPAVYDGGNYDTAVALAVDAAGNVVVAGSSINASGNSDFVTATYSGSTGSPGWSRAFDGGLQDEAAGLALDSSGNACVTGSSLNANGDADYVTLKYDASTGNPLWANPAVYDGGGDDYAHALAVDGDGHVAVTGGSRNAGGGNDYATLKYDGGSGSAFWASAARYDNGGDDRAFFVAADAAGNVVVTGASDGGATGEDWVTVKYGAAAGGQAWAKRFDGPVSGDEQPAGLALDAAGNVFVAGAAATGVSSSETATVKYDPAGLGLWTAVYDPGSGPDTPVGLALAGGNLYVTGSYARYAARDAGTLKYLLGPPASPTGLVATVISSSQVALFWTDTSLNEASFQIARSTDGGVTFPVMRTAPADATTFLDTGLAASTTYTYQVRAANADGNSSWSSPAGVTTFGPPPAAPDGLKATAVSRTQINLAWNDKSGNEVSFEIQRKPGGLNDPGAFVLIALMGANGNSFADHTLTAGTTYSYKVRRSMT